MTERIQYQKNESELVLIGELDYNTLNELWKEPHLLDGINVINLDGLTRVDSSGLALLTYWSIKQNLTLTKLSDKLTTLISLYDLDSVLLINHS